MKFMLIGAVLIAISSSVHAVNVETTTTISNIYTYGEDTGQINNDIVINVAEPVTNCESGFWVKSTDGINNKNIVSILLSAFHSNSKVYFGADTEQRWSGSSSNYCKIHSIGLVN